MARWSPITLPSFYKATYSRRCGTKFKGLTKRTFHCTGRHISNTPSQRKYQFWINTSYGRILNDVIFYWWTSKYVGVYCDYFDLKIIPWYMTRHLYLHNMWPTQTYISRVMNTQLIHNNIYAIYIYWDIT